MYALPTIVGAVAVIDYALLPSTGVKWIDDYPSRKVPAHVLSRLAGVDPRITLAIMRNEIGENGEIIGDVDIDGGPSIGEMMVWKRTAEREGIWVRKSDDEDEDKAYYLAERDNTWKMISWGLTVYKIKLKEANGDEAMALQYYNGGHSGSQRSINYRNRAVAWLRSVGYGI